MDQLAIYVGLVLCGVCFGSFAGASIWRLRARQLKEEKKLNKTEHTEYEHLKKLNESKLINDRSMCLHCGYILKWYDLIPVFSWLSLGGKCRECRRPIGYMEIIIELAVGLFFILSYIMWPQPLDNPISLIQFILWLVVGVGLSILFVYDLKWFLLPDKINVPLIVLGAINASLVIYSSLDKAESLASILGSVLILSGIYLIIYIVSDRKWIGFGDVKLGLALGLMLADWRLAFIALFLANLIGCLAVLPGVFTNTLKRNSHISFGPLLILGFLIAQFFGVQIIEWYMSLI